MSNILTKTDYQGAVTDYRYDSANRLVSMRNPDYVEVWYQYDPAGRLLTRILSNGTTTSYGYDDNNRLVSLKSEHANGSVVGEQTYARDRVGNIQTVTTSEGTTMFTYDPLYRLTDAVYPRAGNTYNYTYDGVGNRLTQTIDTTTQAYIYNEGNRLLEIRDGSVTGPLVNQFSYDDDGNMTERRDGLGTLLQSNGTDAKGRITQMTTGGQPFTYAYDPFDYRISKLGPGVAAEYLLEGEHVEKVTGSHQPAQFFRGVVIDEIVNGYQYDPQGVWTNYTYAHDSLQSVVGLSGHEGATIQTTQYSPFGEEIDGAGASCSVLRYTGRERDAESGLYYYRARYYDPELGRFITEDPLGFGAGDVNFYAYVGNNPINANDPSGKVCPNCVTGIIAGTGAAVAAFLSDAPAEEVALAFGAGFVVGSGLGVITTAITTATAAGAAAIQVATGTVGAAAADALIQTGNIGILETPGGFDFGRTGIAAAAGALGSGPAAVSAFSRGIAAERFGASSIAARAHEITVSDQIAFETVGVGVGQGVNAVVDSFSRLFGGNSSAAGGFLLYPNKPNLNSLQSIYRK